MMAQSRVVVRHQQRAPDEHEEGGQEQMDQRVMVCVLLRSDGHK